MGIVSSLYAQLILINGYCRNLQFRKCSRMHPFPLMTNKMEGEDRKELERKGEGGRQGGGA